MLVWMTTTHARTTRSCKVEINFISEQYQVDGVWRDHRPKVTLNAGRMKFSASAPAASHNKARMRASKKAESCINRWWDGNRCRKATWSSYDRQLSQGNNNINDLMKRSICRSLRAVRRTDLLGHMLKGKLYGRILGDRCCYHSGRGCPYNYGQASVGMVSVMGNRGREIWPGVYHYVQCDQR